MISTPPPRSLRDKCLELRDKVEAFLTEEPETQILRDVQDQVRRSIEAVDEALHRYRYVRKDWRVWADAYARRPEQISLSYNGGKDCESHITL
jgi:FAD synthetase